MSSQSVLTERELEEIFSGKKKKKQRNRYLQIFLNFFIFLFVTAIVFSIINYRSIFANLNFWYQNNYNIQKPTSSTQNSIIVNNGTPSQPEINLPEISDNSLFIPIINIKAPITWQISNNPTDVGDSLSRGIIQIKGTALPGQIGNVFITGHSSNYPWAKGDYNNIFALIGQLVVGEKIQLKYQNQNYLYEVSSIKVVSPTDISVLQPTKDSVLTLMTCTPVGTSLNRLIVISKQTYPDPSKNASVNFNNQNGSLPNVR